MQNEWMKDDWCVTEVGRQLILSEYLANYLDIFLMNSVDQWFLTFSNSGPTFNFQVLWPTSDPINTEAMKCILTALFKIIF